MTFLAERLSELRRHLDHLEEIRERVPGPESLRRDLTLHNDVLFSLLAVCQLVIDIAGELATRRGLKFADYTEAVRNLAAYEEIAGETVRELERLPGFRNVLIHEYVQLDLARAVEALDRLAPVAAFAVAVARIAKTSPDGRRSERGRREA